MMMYYVCDGRGVMDAALGYTEFQGAACRRMAQLRAADAGAGWHVVSAPVVPMRDDVRAYREHMRQASEAAASREWFSSCEKEGRQMSLREAASSADFERASREWRAWMRHFAANGWRR